MRLLARQIPAVGLQEGPARERPALRAFISIVFEHAFLEKTAEKTRNTRFFAGRFQTGPLGYVFVEGHRDVA
jgi:hypothetical protein